MIAGPRLPDFATLSRELIQNFGRVKLLVFDFDGVFTDNRVYVSQDGSESVLCWRSDGLGLSKVKQFGIPVWVISTERNPVVSARCNKLQIDCIPGCEDKLAALKDIARQHGCLLKETAFVGNDINDQSCLEAVGLPIVVADAHPDVVNCALYTTLNPGGRGAVREICDLIVPAHQNE